MKEIVYHEIDWEEERKEVLRQDKLIKYQPREKDLNFMLISEAILTMKALECGFAEVVSNRIDIAKKYINRMNVNGKYHGINSNEKIENIIGYYDIVYEFSWFEGSVNTEAENVIKEYLAMEYIDKIKSKRFNKKIVQMTDVGQSVRMGFFELAKKKIQKYKKLKSVTTIDDEIIYDFYKFYLIFVDYSLGIGTISKERLNELFLKIFSEHQKGNRTIFFEYGGLIGIYEVYYLYYRYFLGLPEEEVTPEHVFESGEKGILHWREK